MYCHSGNMFARIEQLKTGHVRETRGQVGSKYYNDQCIATLATCLPGLGNWKQDIFEKQEVR